MSKLIHGIGNQRRASWGRALAPGCSFRGGMMCASALAFPVTVAEWPRTMAYYTMCHIAHTALKQRATARDSVAARRTSTTHFTMKADTLRRGNA